MEACHDAINIGIERSQFRSVIGLANGDCPLYAYKISKYAVAELHPTT